MDSVGEGDDGEGGPLVDDVGNVLGVGGGGGGGNDPGVSEHEGVGFFWGERLHKSA